MPKPTHINVKIEIDETLTDADDCADALEKIADAIAELVEEARTVLRASKNDDAENRARAYWLGHMENWLDRHAEDGCDGIYGTVQDLRESDEDE